MSNINFYDPEERPWPNPRLKNASIIGHTTTNSVRLWLRVDRPGNYWLVVASHPIPTNGTPEISSSDGQTYRCLLSTDAGETQEIPTERIYPLEFDSGYDITKVVDLESLQPDSRYYYCLLQTNSENPWILGHEDKLSVQTFPEQTKEVNFGLYSCHMPYDGRNLVNMEMWELFYQELSDAKARFIIGAGDQMYVDGNLQLNIWSWLRQVKDQMPNRYDMLSWYRDLFRGYWGILPLRRVLRSFPTYMIWDDHEIMDGWGSFTEKELVAQVDATLNEEDREYHLALTLEMFQAAKQVYYEYEHSHNPPTDDTIEQFDYEFNAGISAFYVLDMRGHRDFNRDSLRILGPQQWERLTNWIDRQYRGDSRVLFIVSPTPVVHLNNFILNNFDIPYMVVTDDMRDNWEHEAHGEEKNKLLGTVFQFSQETQRPVIFLSGDVHLGAGFKLSHQDFPAARVFQLTSSPITHATIKKFSRRILEMLVKESGNLGTIPGNTPYQFQNLYLCRRNNFGIVRVKETDEGELSIKYDLFGGTGRGDGTVEKKRIDLNQVP